MHLFTRMVCFICIIFRLFIGFFRTLGTFFHCFRNIYNRRLQLFYRSCLLGCAFCETLRRLCQVNGTSGHLTGRFPDRTNGIWHLIAQPAHRMNQFLKIFCISILYLWPYGIVFAFHLAKDRSDIINDDVQSIRHLSGIRNHISHFVMRIGFRKRRG